MMGDKVLKNVTVNNYIECCIWFPFCSRHLRLILSCDTLSSNENERVRTHLPEGPVP